MNKQNGIRSYFKFHRQTAYGSVITHKSETAVTYNKLLILFLVSLVFSIAFSYLLSNQPTVLIRSDHFSRWYATYKMVTEQRSLYDPQNGKEIVALNSIPFDPIEGSFFYPAYMIVYILPFVWFPYPLAHFIWLILIQLFLILAIWLIYREIKWPNSFNQFTLFFFLSIFFIPNFQNTIWGQFNTIAVISLALIYICLRRQRYFLAGILATGMTFKPQQMLLTLTFLLVWALILKERRRFIFGFILGMLVLGLFANYFEPNWVNSFIRGVIAYSAYLQPDSVFSLTNIPGWVPLLILIFFSLWLFPRNLASNPSSISFTGCIIVSLGIWWLAVPVLGMLHLVTLPVAILLLFSALERIAPRLYKYGLLAFLILYILGIIGFLYGLSSPGLYALHIHLAELAYKLIAPILLVILAIPLCLSRKDELLILSKDPYLST